MSHTDYYECGYFISPCLLRLLSVFFLLRVTAEQTINKMISFDAMSDIFLK